jgi:hypothetical protein
MPLPFGVRFESGCKASASFSIHKIFSKKSPAFLLEIAQIMMCLPFNVGFVETNGRFFY